MKKDFDFENIGKQVPYRVPAGFFDEMQKNVMERTKRSVRRRKLLLRLSPVVLAAAAVLSAIVFLPQHYEPVRVEHISQATAESSSWIEDMSDEDLEAMDEFASYDIFMD